MGVSQRLIALVTAAAMSGCTVTEKFAHVSPIAPTPPASIVAAWNNKVLFEPDPARQGIPAPGLAGRVYLFGPVADFPVAGNGAMVVDLYDDTPRQGQPTGVQLEQWRFEPDTLQKLLKKDTVGLGYTLFLPWGSYRPDIKTVRLTLRYEAPGAQHPLYAPSAPMTLDHSFPPTGTSPVGL